MELLDAVLRETRPATRSLLRAPAFSFVAVLTLALGLAAATTIFTLVDHVVIRPLPYPNADRLVHLGTLWPKVKPGEQYLLSKGQYFFFKRNSRVLADLMMYDGDIFIVPGDATHPAERVSAVDVSASTFRMLGIRPEKGRVIREEEERNPDGQPRVAMLSHGYWMRRFGGDPDIIGKRLRTGDTTSLEIIGVLPAGASLPDIKADIWIREHLDPSESPQNNHTHQAIGLLRPGVTLGEALADVKRVQQRMEAEYPTVYPQAFLNRVGFAMSVTSLRDHVVGATVVRGLWLIFAAVAFVMLIAAANVANLFLVRIEARRREMAVRTALGAGRAHLAIHYLTETLMVAGAAAITGIALGAALLRVVLPLAPQSLPRLDEVSAFDWRAIAFCLASATTFGLIFGLLPSSSTHVDVEMLRDGGRGLTTSKPREVMRRALVLVQVAFAIVLLSSAGLMVESFARLRQVDPGFDPRGVETMTILLPSRYWTGQAEPFWRAFIGRVEAMPGVVHAGAADQLPLASGFGCSGVIVDITNAAGENGNCMPMGVITPGYLEAMGIKFRGTAPTWESVESGAAPTIVTQAFGRRFWEGRNPIGHWVKPYNQSLPPFTISAITGDIRGTSLEDPPLQAVFFPLVSPPGTPKYWSNGIGAMMSLAVKAADVSPARIARDVRGLLAQIEPNAAISDVQPMELIVAKSMAQTSFTMLLMLLAGAIALTLSTVGIYGVIAYVVGQRRGEIGIRLALGAQVGAVARLVVGQSLAIAGVGVAVGLLCALAGTRLLRSLLFEVSPSDPYVLGVAAFVLMLAAAAASIGPVWRAVRIDPVEAMRA